MTSFTADPRLVPPSTLRPTRTRHAPARRQGQGGRAASRREARARVAEERLPDEEKDEDDGGKLLGKETSVIVNQLACKEAGCPDVEVVMTLLQRSRGQAIFKVYKAAADERRDVESALSKALTEEHCAEQGRALARARPRRPPLGTTAGTAASMTTVAATTITRAATRSARWSMMRREVGELQVCMCARTRLCSLPWTRLAAALALVGVPCRRRWTAPPSRHNPRMGMRMNCKNGAQGLYAMRMRGRTRPDLLLYTGGAPHSAACNPLSVSMSKRRMSALFSASREVVD